MEEEILSPPSEMHTSSSSSNNEEQKDEKPTMLNLIKTEGKYILELEKACKKLRETPENNIPQMLEHFNAFHQTLDCFMKKGKEMKQKVEANDNLAS